MDSSVVAPGLKAGQAEVGRDHTANIADYIRKYPDNLEQSFYVLSTIRKLERVGDQCKNIAEELIFYVEAKVLKHSSVKKKKN
jgi:phosphate transport system protein